MNEQKKTHPEEEILERFAMGRLDEPELGQFEDHLLVCGHCQERLDEVTEFAGVMREATANLAAQPPVEAAWRRWLRLDWLPVPVPALAGAMVILVGILAWQPWRPATPAEWQTVELATLRGAVAGNTGLVGYALHLRLDVEGLDTAGAAAMLVDASGTPVAEMPVTLVQGKAEVRHREGLTAGQYWVRLRKAGETIREYSLAVKRP